MDRRGFMKGSALGVALGAAQGQIRAQTKQRSTTGRLATESSPRTAFWPNGARLVVSPSLQMEAGAQPDRGRTGRGTSSIRNIPTTGTKWYEYGFKEGIPRLLDMYDRKKVHVTSHMVGMAVEKHSP